MFRQLPASSNWDIEWPESIDAGQPSTVQLSSEFEQPCNLLSLVEFNTSSLDCSQGKSSSFAHDSSYNANRETWPLENTFASLPGCLIPDADSGRELEIWNTLIDSIGLSTSAFDSEASPVTDGAPPRSQSDDRIPAIFQRSAYIRGREVQNPSENTCVHCGKIFRARRTLLRHLREVHARKTRFCCPHEDCGFHERGFPRRGNLQRHLARMHAGDGRRGRA